MSDAKDALVEQVTAASVSASAVTRQLAFGGVATVWLFSGANVSAKSLLFPAPLLWAGLCLVLALAFDLLQAAYRAASFEIALACAQRRGEPASAELSLNRWIHWPTRLLFYGKMILVAVAYVILAYYMVGRVIAI